MSKLLKKIDEEQDGEIVSQGSDANIKLNKKVMEASADLVDGEKVENVVAEGGGVAEGGEIKPDGEGAEVGEGEKEVAHEEEDDRGE